MARRRAAWVRQMAGEILAKWMVKAVPAGTAHQTAWLREAWTDPRELELPAGTARQAAWTDPRELELPAAMAARAAWEETGAMFIRAST